LLKRLIKYNFFHTIIKTNNTMFILLCFYHID
jgi:hypothetical protein